MDEVTKIKNSFQDQTGIPVSFNVTGQRMPITVSVVANGEAKEGSFTGVTVKPLKNSSVDSDAEAAKNRAMKQNG